MIVQLGEAKQLILAAVAELTGDQPWIVWADIGAVRDVTVLQHQLFDKAIRELAGEGRVRLREQPVRSRLNWIVEYNAVTWAGQRTHLVRLNGNRPAGG